MRSYYYKSGGNDGDVAHVANPWIQSRFAFNDVQSQTGSLAHISIFIKISVPTYVPYRGPPRYTVSIVAGPTFRNDYTVPLEIEVTRVRWRDEFWKGKAHFIRGVDGDFSGAQIEVDRKIGLVG